MGCRVIRHEYAGGWLHRHHLASALRSMMTYAAAFLVRDLTILDAGVHDEV